jgi:hypothetical protein
MFTYLRLNVFILHILLNHVAALDLSSFCLMFLQLQATSSSYAANSGLTQTPHSRLCKEKFSLDRPSVRDGCISRRKKSPRHIKEADINRNKIFFVKGAKIL